ncbi:MAG: tetratricopeptide repeat protein [SAR324 cluster bacterium]|nr:tetratricopeptide repeat protein [SAR324 cluster bacterium]
MLLEKGTEQAIFAAEAEIRDDPENPFYHYQAAKLYLLKNNIERARLRIKKALLLESQNASFRLLAGKIEFQAQDYFQATGHLTTTLSLDANLLEAYYLLALAYHQTGKSTEAIIQLEKSIELEPLYFDAHLAWVDIKFQTATSTKDFPLLTTKLEQALRINPGSAKGVMLLSELYQRLGAGLKARLVLDEWLQKFGSSDEILLAMAKLDLEAGYLLEARSVLKLIETPSIQAQLLLLRLEKDQKGKLLIVEVEELIKKSPNELDLWLFLSELHFDAGQLKEAERIIQRALRLEPKSGEAYFRLSILYQKQGDITGAKWSLGKALELEPTQLKYQVFYLESLLAQGKFTQAEEALKGYDLDETHAGVLYIKGRLFKGQGNFKEARSYFERAERLNQSQKIDIQLADLEILEGSYNQAEKRIQARLKANKNDLDSLLLLAKLRFAQKQPKEVVRLLNRHLNTDRKQGQVQLFYAEAIARVSGSFKAIKILKKALDKWPREPELIQAYTFYLGVAGRYSEAIPILEDAESINHPLHLLLKQRLLLYYHLAKKAKKFKESVFYPNLNP